jgi:hypothetical protein
MDWLTVTLMEQRTAIMRNTVTRTIMALGACGITLALIPAPSHAQEVASCPCNYAGAIRTRALTGNEMRCVSEDIDIANLPPHGVTNKQNNFSVRALNRKGQTSKSYRFSLNEQGLLAAADFGGVVRYAPTCQVIEAGKSRIRVRDAAYVLSAEEYAECARDLSALVQSVVATASNAPVSNCEDVDQTGVLDAWEPMVPVSTSYCFDDFGNMIACPALP